MNLGDSSRQNSLGTFLLFGLCIKKTKPNQKSVWVCACACVHMRACVHMHICVAILAVSIPGLLKH